MSEQEDLIKKNLAIAYAKSGLVRRIGGEDWIRVSEVVQSLKDVPTVEVPENAVNCVLTMFGKCSYNETGCSDCEIKDKIRKALSERPQGKWIPVDERLPEERGMYLVTEKEFAIDDRNHRGKFKVKTEQVEFHDGKWNRAKFYEVVAWQPLPEPYKKEGDKE